MDADDLPPNLTATDDQIPAEAVIVGIDGSARDETCVTWAAGAATRAGRPLHLLHAYDLGPGMAAGDIIGLRGVPAGAILPDPTNNVLADQLEIARARWPELSISGSQPWGNPESALIDASEGAHLVVVGSRPVSGLQRLVLGRSSLAAAMHAHCPVVLLPEGSRTDAQGPVVLGVDGSDHSALAAARAFWIARIRGTSVRAVIAWNVEVVDGAVVTTPGSPGWDSVQERYRAIADRVVAPLRAEYPDVPCEISVEHGSAAAVLTAASADASLLVLGSRGRGGFRGMLLGSVAHKVIETSASPVMVVRRA